ncbi:MAG TPA: hypothetical protein VKA46_17455 [Gemmataceae bacterium]|nr:hypothetical protein [Gemmataceae bacterium]
MKALEEAWRAALEECAATPPKGKEMRGEPLEEPWYVLVTCRDEKHQVELLGRFKAEGRYHRHWKTDVEPRARW